MPFQQSSSIGFCGHSSTSSFNFLNLSGIYLAHVLRVQETTKELHASFSLPKCVLEDRGQLAGCAYTGRCLGHLSIVVILIHAFPYCGHRVHASGGRGILPVMSLVVGHLLLLGNLVRGRCNFCLLWCHFVHGWKRHVRFWINSSDVPSLLLHFLERIHYDIL